MTRVGKWRMKCTKYVQVVPLVETKQRGKRKRGRRRQRAVQRSKGPGNDGVITDQKASSGNQGCGAGNPTAEKPSKRRSVI
uniref:Uncharacterized protein n=1 Tax=Tanacetum cinerariifolium TaxID=118510 RepID=A0A699JV86_TANCI|nr:hypothetical protein [Tanacetum cinerariifolium]